jgi:hypothetical protein
MDERVECVCPECLRTFKVPSQYVGKRIRCKGCQAEFRIELPREKSATKSRSGAAYEDPDAAPRPKTRRPAKKEEPVDPWMQDDEEEDALEAAPLPKKRPVKRPVRKEAEEDDRPRRRRARGSSEGSGGGSWLNQQSKSFKCFMVVIGLIASAWMTRLVSPGAGSAIMLVAAIVAMLAGVAMSLYGGLKCLGLAFEEDFVCGILWLFVPLYGLYFIATRWDTTKDYVIMSLMGQAMLYMTAFSMQAMGH